MSKYYTPEIEEFHKDFVFEYKPRIRDGVMSYVNNKFRYVDSWKKQVFKEKVVGVISLEISQHTHPPSGFESLETYLKDGAIRVKHLDREDIESFNFKQSNLHSNIFLKECDEWNHRPAECIGINFNEGFDHLMIFFVEKGGEIKYGQTIFAGKLKNKPELKRILKQIGV